MHLDHEGTPRNKGNPVVFTHHTVTFITSLCMVAEQSFRLLVIAGVQSHWSVQLEKGSDAGVVVKSHES